MKKQSGFTLIELVIVVVILGFLAVTAIPKFLDLTDQAKEANIEGMAGGFATAVSLARAQWEAEGRPKNSSGLNVVSYDGTELLLTTENNTATNLVRPGYVVASTAVSGDGAGLGTGFDAGNCVDIWNSILQQPPKTTSDISTLNTDKSMQYYVAKTGSNATSLCVYYLKETMPKDTNGNYTATGIDSAANFFTYQPANSFVEITINN
ncbi:type II secretion system protein [Thalassotalea marina]|uniref:MSHA biogenesis protein MshB n=1 Tax=Thalassotalea marina TaxID=1673741 RepID=A0A919BCC0_9GAMM|nr:type II secretion system protein [Thalassotalea marina]GHF82817.1 MSHA biogenesis protein MshB [Thalassotalea marina]